ncbi:MAG TPA: SurA N-terminal domain-containing protein [Ferruginibacter sp.]|nr:SurA N-terminal domain-containing protein [Ferruginibacter sp.]
MQIIQGIRDKGAAIVIVVIALSLIGFILMDAKQGSGTMFSSTSTNIGKVNGSAIEQAEFNKKINIIEAQEEQQSGMKPTTVRLAQIREQVWNQIVAEKVFYAESAKLGIDFTAKELSALLSSNDQSNPLLQDKQMIDPATGQLDMSKVSQALNNIKKMKGEQRDMIDAQIIEPQKLTSISTKYFALLNASAYYPAWMEEKDVAENKTFVTVSYVAVPYSVISDSTIKVTDSEIEKYIKSHKQLFKQEEGRMISYVAFSQLPSAADSAKTKAAVQALANEFANEANMKAFIARNTSAIPYDTNYLPKSKIQSNALDTILKQPAGTVYGPYVDNGNYVLAKVLGSRSFPDTVSARHILIGTVNPQTGEPILEDSIAKKRADSIFSAIQNGADFGALVKQFSTDEGSKEKGGEYPSIYYGQMVPEFNEFAFTKPVGSKAVVKTQFGYHIIEVLKQKGQSPAYKIAFMAKEIMPSETTINKASLDATKLSAEKDAKKMDAYLQKNGLRKVTNPTLIKENDANIGQMQEARQLVRWVFEAKQGDVSDPYSIGDEFVVAIVDKVQEEGTQDIATARPMVEGIIRDEKKAEEIIKKLGNTLESAAAAYGKQVLTAGQDSSLTFNSQMINGIGGEPKLIGASFNKANLNKVSAPIAGKTGVYVLRVDAIGAKAADTPDQASQFRSQQISALRSQSATNWFEALRKKATIKDNRSKFY